VVGWVVLNCFGDCGWIRSPAILFCIISIILLYILIIKTLFVRLVKFWVSVWILTNDISLELRFGLDQSQLQLTLDQLKLGPINWFCQEINFGLKVWAEFN